jgi:DNA-binding NarL/FixJ family response regulator
MDLQAQLTAGATAIKAGDWPAARDAFGAALAQGESAEALFGLATAQIWLGDVRASMASLERAYGVFRRRPEPMGAAACALRLAFSYKQHLGNPAAASGWLARAARIVEDEALTAARGELTLMRAFLSDDPVAGEALARDAIAIARRAADRDLELSAMSQLGALLVAQGRVPEGIALLDEAMAGCLGGEPNMPETVIFASCLTMTACTRCADFERAVQWVRASEALADRLAFPFFYVECRTLHARVLFATGDWARAEETARSAIDMSRGPGLSYYPEALATLAELRLAQGRLEEAERLLDGFEGHHATVEVIARAHLLRGKPALAAATVRRRLDQIATPTLERGLLEELLGEAEIAQGERAEAAARGERLVAMAAACGCQVLLARGHRLRGQALADDDPAAARRHLDLALAGLMHLGMAYEIARTRHLLAQALRDAEPELAAEEARTALATFEGLGAARDADAAAALLRQLGVKAARSGPKRLDTLTKREREVLALLGEALSNPEIARRLFVSRKTVENHVASILAKLGLKSRAEAAAEAARQGARAKSAPK